MNKSIIFLLCFAIGAYSLELAEYCFFKNSENDKCLHLQMQNTKAANRCNSSKPRSNLCESLDFLQEIDKILKIDSAKDSVIAEYCLHYDAQKDSIWKLFLYEQIAPLSMGMQKECGSYSISNKITLEAGEIFPREPSLLSAFCTKTCIGSKKTCEERERDKCKIDINKSHSIYDFISDFSINSCFKEIGIDKISHLFNRHLPIKWDLKVSCDDEKIPVLGSHYIYISEICNEKQLEKIKENKLKKSAKDE